MNFGDTDLVEHIHQRILTVGLECSIDVSREVGVYVTQALPVGPDGILRVFVRVRSQRGELAFPKLAGARPGEEHRDLIVS